MLQMALHWLGKVGHHHSVSDMHGVSKAMYAKQCMLVAAVDRIMCLGGSIGLEG